MKLLTIKELSQLLLVKEKTLYQWAELGTIPCLKMNGTLRFDLDDIEKWVGNCKRYSQSGYNPFAQTSNRCPKKGGKG